MSETAREPKIAFFDIETAPSLGWYFDKFKEGNILSTQEDWFILSYAVKWSHQKRIRTRALPDYPRYRRDKGDDRFLVKDLWQMMHEADIIVAHNGDKFDIRKANARFIKHGLTPPAPYKSIDTLKIARKHFQFDGNRLDDLARYFGIGSKLPNTGKDLWFGCMNGDKKAWSIMRRYNAHDVYLLEKVYERLRPYAVSHPDLRLYDRSKGCPKCKSPLVMKRGFGYTQLACYQKYQCRGCGGWFNGEKIKRP